MLSFASQGSEEKKDTKRVLLFFPVIRVRKSLSGPTARPCVFCLQASDDEEHQLRRETAQLLHARAGARARVDANSAAIFDITGTGAVEYSEVYCLYVVSMYCTDGISLKLSKCNSNCLVYLFIICSLFVYVNSLVYLLLYMCVGVCIFNCVCVCERESIFSLSLNDPCYETTCVMSLSLCVFVQVLLFIYSPGVHIFCLYVCVPM